MISWHTSTTQIVRTFFCAFLICFSFSMFFDGCSSNNFSQNRYSQKFDYTYPTTKHTYKNVNSLLYFFAFACVLNVETLNLYVWEFFDILHLFLQLFLLLFICVRACYVTKQQLFGLGLWVWALSICSTCIYLQIHILTFSVCQRDFRRGEQTLYVLQYLCILTMNTHNILNCFCFATQQTNTREILNDDFSCIFIIPIAYNSLSHSHSRTAHVCVYLHLLQRNMCFHFQWWWE